MDIEKNKENKKKIVQTATRLFMKDGCKRVTMDTIASQMRISKRTLYELFSNKEELLNACLQEINKEVESQCIRIYSMVDEPIFLTIFLLNNFTTANSKYETLIEDIERYYPNIKTHSPNKQSDEMHREIMNSLTKAQEKGIFREHTDLNQAFLNIETIIRNPPDISEKGQKNAWAKKLSDTCYTYIRGMMTTEAIIRYDAQEEKFQQLLMQLSEDETIQN